MRKVIFAFFMLSSIGLSAQCSVDKDEFTGIDTRTAKAAPVLNKLSPPNYLDLILYSEGGDYFIKVDWQGPIEKEMIIDKNDYLALKTSDGVVTGKILRDCESVKIKISGLYKIDPIFSVSKEDIELLSKSTLESLRITVESRKMDYKIKPAKTAKLQAAAKCVLGIK